MWGSSYASNAAHTHKNYFRANHRSLSFLLLIFFWFLLLLLFCCFVFYFNFLLMCHLWCCLWYKLSERKICNRFYFQESFQTLHEISITQIGKQHCSWKSTTIKSLSNFMIWRQESDKYNFCCTKQWKLYIFKTNIWQFEGRIWRRWKVMCSACTTPIQMVIIPSYW